MKYRKIIFILIVLFISKLTFAQILHKSDEKILWTDKKIVQNGNEINTKKFYHLNFKNSEYLDSYNLPYFAKVINLKKYNYNGGEIIISLENKKYEILSESDKSGVRNLSEIKNNIEIENKIYSARRVPLLSLNFVPLRLKNGKIERLVSFTLVIKEGEFIENKSQKSKDLVENSVLNSGKWVKIGITESGIYKITDRELTDLGFSNPSAVRVFGNDEGLLPFNNSEEYIDDLTENDILRASNYILFYAKAPTVWDYNENKGIFMHRLHIYSDTAYYFLTDKNTGYSNSIKTENQASGTNNLSINSYDFRIFHEKEGVNLLNSGRIWLGESFQTTTSQDFSFEMSNLVDNSEMKLYVSVVARSPVVSSFNFTSNNLNKSTSIASATGDSHSSFYAKTSSNLYTHNASTSDNINLNINYNKPAPSSDAWLNFIDYNAKCALKLVNGQLQFRDASTTGAGNITKFNLSETNSNTVVWDITNSNRPKKINVTNSGSSLNFKVETETLKEFVAYDGSNFLTPYYIGNNMGEIENQDLHAISANTEMIIVTHLDFLAQAEEIAQIHRDHDNMTVKVATTEAVYNEFSSGIPDISAIRNFVKLAYWKNNSKLKYLLLLGDGSYKNKSDIEPDAEINSNFILTYQTHHSYTSDSNLLTTTSDDYFALLDDDEGELEGNLDIGVGRIPVKTPEEASEMVAKIRSYLNPDNKGDWQNILCFVGDDEDSNTHMDDAEQLSTKIDTLYPSFIIKKIFLDAYNQEVSAVGEEYPQAVIELNNRINKGALIVNYSGHGSTQTLAHERLVTINDINNWNNFERLSLFFTGTCEFSRFDGYSQTENKSTTSAGEYVFLNPEGGAIAMFTTARVSYSQSNFNLNNNAYDYMFEGDEDGQYSFGDVYMRAKNVTTGKNRRYFALFGDPALKLNYAKNEIITTSINGNSVKTTDTLSALELVTITGEIRDRSGNKLTNFNGTVYPTVLDKNKEFKTLGNGGEEPFYYFYQNNTLFKGRASVTNGDFSFSFIVPKDIYYNYGYGKISYFAKDGNVDGRGYFKDFIIGGTSDNVAEDNIGPEIQLFMNDSTFINGGMTNQSPSVFAKLSDESGINTAGSGIGHDITAVVDKNTSQMFVLNDYYEAELNSYQKGKVDYGLYKLDEGEHTLTLKAWDVYNNSSEAEISFLVVESTEFTINRLFNYPNPFTTNTSFFFEHNQPGTELDVLLQIFTVSGKVVKTLHTQMFTTGFRSDPIEWNGTDDFEANIGRGVYIYRLKITTPTGKNVEKYEKLLILK